MILLLRGHFSLQNSSSQKMEENVAGNAFHQRVDQPREYRGNRPAHIDAPIFFFNAPVRVKTPHVAMVIPNGMLVFVWPVRICNFGDARGVRCDLISRGAEFGIANVEISVQDDRNDGLVKKLEVNLGLISVVLNQFRSTNLGFVNFSWLS